MKGKTKLEHIGESKKTDQERIPIGLFYNFSQMLIDLQFDDLIS